MADIDKALALESPAGRSSNPKPKIRAGCMRICSALQAHTWAEGPGSQHAYLLPQQYCEVWLIQVGAYLGWEPWHAARWRPSGSAAATWHLPSHHPLHPLHHHGSRAGQAAWLVAVSQGVGQGGVWGWMGNKGAAGRGSPLPLRLAVEGLGASPTLAAPRCTLRVLVGSRALRLRPLPGEPSRGPGSRTLGAAEASSKVATEEASGSGCTPLELTWRSRPSSAAAAGGSGCVGGSGRCVGSSGKGGKGVGSSVCVDISNVVCGQQRMCVVCAAEGVWWGAPPPHHTRVRVVLEATQPLLHLQRLHVDAGTLAQSAPLCLLCRGLLEGEHPGAEGAGGGARFGAQHPPQISLGEPLPTAAALRAPCPRPGPRPANPRASPAAWARPEAAPMLRHHPHAAPLAAVPKRNLPAGRVHPSPWERLPLPAAARCRQRAREGKGTGRRVGQRGVLRGGGYDPPPGRTLPSPGGGAAPFQPARGPGGEQHPGLADHPRPPRLAGSGPGPAGGALQGQLIPGLPRHGLPRRHNAGLCRHLCHRCACGRGGRTIGALSMLQPHAGGRRCTRVHSMPPR
jgi:hypothetical protein